MVVCARTAAPPYGWPLLSVAQQQVLTRSRRRFDIHDFSLRRAFTKIQGRVLPAMWIIDLHTSHSVVP